MKHLMLAMVEPVVGAEDEFRGWYTTNNIHQILNVEGITALQRFELTPLPGNESPYRFLALYEVEDDGAERASNAWAQVQVEREAALQAGRVPDVQVAPAIGAAIRCFYTAITDRIEAPSSKAGSAETAT